MNLLEIRQKYKISQIQAASSLGIPLRTYIRYEQDNSYGSDLKRKMMIQSLNDNFEVTEDKGLLSVDVIKNELTNLFEVQYKDSVTFCYLFGSYAKGYANEKSDVDLCISTSLTGLKVMGLLEDIRAVLHKRIDLVRFNTLNDNFDLLNEIMKDGVKIYG